MAARYPAPAVGWAARLGEKPSGTAAAEWAETLRGLTPEQIAAGLADDERRGSDFPPSGPHFRRMALGIPDRKAAIRDYQDGVVTPFTRLMRSHTDSWHLHRAHYDEVEKILMDAFAAAADDVEGMGGIAGGVEKAPRLSPPQPLRERAPADPAVALRELDRMRAMLAGGAR
jgi:hypothetical protein